MRAVPMQRLTTLGLAAGAGLITASVFFGGLDTRGIDISRYGFVVLLISVAAYVSCRVRKLTEDDLERARQDGYAQGYEDGSSVRPTVVDLGVARTSLAQRRTAQ